MAPARFAQHFLIDKGAILRIIEAVKIEPGESVVEIGPGRGALTMEIIKRAGKLISIEIDSKMVQDLRSKFGGKKNFQLIHQDILKQDLSQLNSDSLQNKKFKVVGNLPYNLTSPILRKLTFWEGWDRAVIMVQKEVGDRLCASVGSKQYGALTVGMSLSCEAQPLFHLSRDSFRPRPKVESSIVKLTRKIKPLTDNIKKTQRIIQAAFQQRRKTILNSLSHGLGLNKNKVEGILKALDLKPTLRAENLSPEVYVALSKELLTTEP